MKHVLVPGASQLSSQSLQDTMLYIKTSHPGVIWYQKLKYNTVHYLCFLNNEPLKIWLIVLFSLAPEHRGCNASECFQPPMQKQDILTPDAEVCILIRCSTHKYTRHTKMGFNPGELNIWEDQEATSLSRHLLFRYLNALLKGFWFHDLILFLGLAINTVVPWSSIENKYI
jgi:hypothetical protein